MSKIIIFVAPSGSGKTTIIQHLLRTNPHLCFAISDTTRSPRPNERHGLDYYFLSEEKFRKKIEKSQFLEYAEVYEGIFYGTSYAELDRLWEKNKTVIMDLDVEGALNMKKKFLSQQLKTIFIRTPDIHALEARLRSRNTNSPSDLKKRLKKVEIELQYAYEFDYIVVNDKLQEAIQNIECIVQTFIDYNKAISRREK